MPFGVTWAWHSVRVDAPRRAGVSSVWMARLVGTIWALVALWSWWAAYGPQRPAGLLHPLAAVAPLWSLIPPVLFVVIGSRATWAVVAVAAAPFVVWALPRYLMLVTHADVSFSRPGVYHLWVTNVVAAATVIVGGGATAVVVAKDRLTGPARSGSSGTRP